MILSEEIKERITKEYKEWEDIQYNGNNREERQELGAFFTPPELSISMIEKLDNLDGTILDPTCGAGGLLSACIIAGANPKNIYGIEYDERILEQAHRRLIPMGVPKENIHLGNALNEDCYEFKEGYHYDKKKDTVTFKGKLNFKFGG